MYMYLNISLGSHFEQVENALLQESLQTFAVHELLSSISFDRFCISHKIFPYLLCIFPSAHGDVNLVEYCYAWAMVNASSRRDDEDSVITL